MNHAKLHSFVTSTLAFVEANPPAKIGDFTGAIERALENREVPFEDRRYVAMAVADRASARAAGASGPAAKILRSITSAALTVHARWANVGILDRRAPRERATREEIALLAREGRELAAKREILNEAFERLGGLVGRAINEVDERGAFMPATHTVVVDQKLVEANAEPRRVPPATKTKPEKAVTPADGLGV